MRSTPVPCGPRPAVPGLVGPALPGLVGPALPGLVGPALLGLVGPALLGLVGPALLGLVGLALLGLVACTGSPDARDTNLLIVTVDTLRADRLGAYGYEPIETPHIDRLAREGVRFDRALTPVPLTLPAHATLFTGAAPPRHGIRENGSARLSPAATTLAERFRDVGYATGAFVGAFVLDPRYGLSQGFDTFTGPGVVAGATPAEHGASERRGDEVLEDALAWIHRQAPAVRPNGGEATGAGEAPENRLRDGWFAWIHLFDPHAGYAAPEPFGSRYAGRPYDGEVAWVDSLVGRLRAALEESGQWADTTLIFTSDHGEALGDHGEPTHGFFLYEPTLRVPLIVRPADRGSADIGRGIEVPTSVGLVDVVPTVVELWGLEPAGTGDDGEDGLDGRSLAAALRGEPIEPAQLYAETVLPRTQYGWAELKAIVVGPDKFIRAPRPELYDVDEDPGELRNLTGERPRRAAELARGLEDRLTRLEAAPAGSEAATAGNPGTGPHGTDPETPGTGPHDTDPETPGTGPHGADPQTPGTGPHDTDPETRARLRSLGYLGGSGAPGRSSGMERPDPKDRIDAYRTLVEILGVWRDGDAAGALGLLDAVLAREPDSSGAWYHRGLVLSDVGRLDEAIAAFARAWELDPGFVVAARWLARTHRQAGDLGAAVAVLEELLRDDPLDRQLRWEVVQFHLRRDDLPEAERVLQEGLELDPGAASMLLGMGRVELQRDRPGKALQFLDRAVTIAPELNEVHYYRGRGLRGLGRPDEALRAYGVEVSHQPLHFGAHLDRAVLLAGLGRHAEAIESLRAALRARPGSRQVRLLLARTLLASADPDGPRADDHRTDMETLEEARRLAEEVVEVADEPDLRRRGHALLARILRALGRGDEARAHEEAAAGLVGDS